MENMLYLAVFGTQNKPIPENCLPAYGGFGFLSDGSLRIPYRPPEGTVVVFDDHVMPDHTAVENLTELCRMFRIREIIFDFEKAARSEAEELQCGLKQIRSVFLAAPYLPHVPFASYLEKLKKPGCQFIPDLCPIRQRLCDGHWTDDPDKPPKSGKYSEEHICMYAGAQTAAGLFLRFYDTQRTVRMRAEKSGLPCLLPLAEYEQLAKE